MNNYFIPAANLPSSSDPLNALSSNGIDPYKIASGQQYVDPKLFQLYLTASMTNIDTLFNDNSNKDDNSSDDIFKSMSSYSQSPYPQAASSFPSSQSVYEQMIAQSGLIGKTVNAHDPETNQIFSGKVTGVTVESGKLQIIVDGKAIPPENLVSVKE